MSGGIVGGVIGLRGKNMSSENIWAQFHKGLLNIEESMLLNLDLSRPLVVIF